MDDSIREIPRLQSQHGVFEDREDAAHIVLSMVQQDWRNRPEGMVLAIPSGGVPLGLVLSQELHLPLELVIVRKLQIPGNTEAGFGAMTLGMGKSEGQLFLNTPLMTHLGLGSEDVDRAKDVVRRELLKRNTLLRDGLPPPDLSGKDVLIVDDGLASGYTMLAALDMARAQGANRVETAVPTAPLRSAQLASGHADTVHVANLHGGGSFAVANAYRRWRDLDRDEVMRMLRESGYRPSADR